MMIKAGLAEGRALMEQAAVGAGRVIQRQGQRVAQVARGVARRALSASPALRTVPGRFKSAVVRAAGATATMNTGPGNVGGFFKAFAEGWRDGGPFSTVTPGARVLPPAVSSNATRFGTRVQLIFKGKSPADTAYIEELLEGTNRGLGRRPGIVGNKLDFDPKLSNEFLREYFGTKTLREALAKKAALERKLGTPLAVDEIVPRQLGGPQSFPNQRLIPGGLNSTLGRVEQIALEPLAPGTRVLGFDPVFVGH